MAAHALLFNPHRRGTKGRKAPPLAGSRTVKPATTKGERTMSKKKASPKRKAKPTTAKHAAPAARRRTAAKKAPANFGRKYRRNPIGARAKGLFAEHLKPAAIGAGGALALDVAWSKIPFIPLALKTGPVSYVAKGAGAIGLGMAAEKLGLKHDTAVSLARGGLTVALHDLGKSLLRTQFPSFALGVYDDYADAVHGLSALIANGEDDTVAGLTHDGEAQEVGAFAATETETKYF